MEFSVDNFVGIFEEADTLTMRTIDFSLSDIDNFSVLEEFGSIEGWLSSKYNWWTIFHYKQLFELKLYLSEFSANKTSFIVQIIEIELCLLQHLFLRSLINFKLTTHPSNQHAKSTIHIINRLEFACFNLLQRILRKQDGFLLSMQLILLTNEALYYRAIALMEIS